MLSDIIKAGQFVDLQSTRKSEEGDETYKKLYRTKVFDVLSEDQLEILMPIEQQKLILLPVDGEYDLCFVTDNGLYQCFARVLDRYKSNNVYILLAETTSKLEKFQRREYYRYSTSIPLKARTMMDEELRDLDKDVFHVQHGLIMKKCEIRDISGGGMKFLSKTAFEVDDMVVLSFSLQVHGKETVYQLIGRILSCQKLENDNDEYEHRLMFEKIMNSERESIIRFIFEEERKKRSRIQ